MLKCSSETASRPRDLNELAALIVGEATSEGEAPEVVEVVELPEDGENPAAVALRRLGGLNGGKARAAKLTAEERSEIAKEAAATRWGQDCS